MRYYGDVTPGKTMYMSFNTKKLSDQTAITLAGSPVVSVYKRGNTTESTSGVTLTVDYDSRTGYHVVAIDTSADGTFYASGNDFTAVLTAGTVDSVSVVGHEIGTFSIGNRSALRPTTADRTLDVTATGAAGIDWANVENPTTTLALTGTTISSSQIAASVTGNVGGNVSGNVTGSVGSVAAGGITAASIATGAIDADALATDGVEEIRNAITGGAYALSTDANGRIRIVDGTGAGELDTSSGLVSLTDASLGSVADHVWDEPLLDHLGLTTTGNYLLMAASTWGTNLPGAYGAGTAGYILGTNLDATVSSRSSHSAADVWSSGTRTLTGLGFVLGAGDVGSDAVNEIRDAVTGGAYALDTDANGRVRIVDGTAAGEVDLLSGAIVQVNQLGTQAKADVNAEIVDALATDTYAEPSQGAPGATVSLATKINYLYIAWRNKKEVTNALATVFADNGTTAVVKQDLTDNGSTLTIAEFISGA